MSLKTSILFMLAVALLHGGASAAADAGAPAFTVAEAAFTKAAAGDGEATEQAVKAFEALAAANTPESPLYQAYLGAAQALQGRDAWMPWTKMKATERGLDTLDKALRRLEAAHDKLLVRGTPVSLEARLVAATTFLAVPDSFFHRADRGRQLFQEIAKSPIYADAPPGFRAEVQKRAATAAK